ncbi:hypothetical protein J6590_012634 [Homalodisca vitripennis]|nr:hypothetical protein J6590_012634 [Homalodisca vitripennis]
MAIPRHLDYTIFCSLCIGLDCQMKRTGLQIPGVKSVAASDSRRCTKRKDEYHDMVLPRKLKTTKLLTTESENEWTIIDIPRDTCERRVLEIQVGRHTCHLDRATLSKSEMSKQSKTASDRSAQNIRRFDSGLLRQTPEMPRCGSRKIKDPWSRGPLGKGRSLIEGKVTHKPDFALAPQWTSCLRE